MKESTYHITSLEMKAAVLKVPAAPEIFVKLGKMLKDKETEMLDVVRLVEKDPALVAKVLRFSNTAYYNSGEPIGSLEEAINRIGFAELLRIVGMASIGEIYGVWNLAYGVGGDVIWHNSLAVGLVMEQFAAANGEDLNGAYTLGILRSLGKLIINNCAKTHNEPPVYDIEKDMPLLMWEKNVFDNTNPFAADHVLESWCFPEKELIGLRFQYNPELAPEPNRFACMLNIAGQVAEKIGKAMPGESSYWNGDDDGFLEVAGLSNAHVKSATGRASEKLSKILDSLKN
ncbi:HDOD domain-containing protein [Puniceicoccaceae bacterium K14]|nr:HDOD domain-containing protein [Puniceicoccaceae bacterium K14]